MIGVIAGVTALFAFVAPGALAAGGPSSGVHVDPGSPAGKQYSIPIASARGETSGQSLGSGSGSAGPPLFGAGVTPASSGGATTAGSRRSVTGAKAFRSRGSSHDSTSSSVSAGADRARASLPGAGPPVPSAASDSSTQSNAVGGSSWLPLAGGGALVLLLGCGTGFALRRRM